MKCRVNSEARLLPFLRQKFPEEVKTSDIRWSIEHHRCWVNGSVERFPSMTLRPGSDVEIDLGSKPSFQREPERILYEDEELLVYNKPAALSSEDLATLLDARLVHRLDRDTTGVILLAKTAKIQASLEDLFRKREVLKEYRAIIYGKMDENKGEISLPLQERSRRQGAVLFGVHPKGKPSVTEWTLLNQKGELSYLALFPKTGRTHQIRVHLSCIGYPIVGDVDYGPKFKSPAYRPLLHAFKLTFTHPSTQQTVSLHASEPEDFRHCMKS